MEDTSFQKQSLLIEGASQIVAKTIITPQKVATKLVPKQLLLTIVELDWNNS